MISKTVLDQIQNKLELQKKDNLARMEELRSEDPFNIELQDPSSNDRTSPDDDAQVNEVHERIAAQIGSIEKLLVRIDSALERIANGTYGVCEACGQPIEESRVSIMPLASLCMKDEKQIEQKVKKAA